MLAFLLLLLLGWFQLPAIDAFATVELIAPKIAHIRTKLSHRHEPTACKSQSPLEQNGRPLFAVKENGVAIVATTKGKKKLSPSKSNGDKSTVNRRDKNKSPKQRSHVNEPAQQQYKRTTNNRPYAAYSTEELKQLTEYHLSKSITSKKNIDNQETTLIGSMSSQQMQEFAKLISSWSKLTTNNRSERTLAAEMSEQCLRELIEEKLAGNKRTIKVMNVDMYHSVIRAWLKTNSYVDLLHASSLLDLMERTHKGEEKILSQSIRCYATVLDGWCKSRYNGAEVKAEELLHRMCQRCPGHVDVRYYNNVMNRIAVSGKINAGNEVERLLNVLIEAYKRGETSMMPNRSTFNTAIKAYSRVTTTTKGGKDAAKDARRILSMMEDPASFGLGNVAREIEPDKVSCTSLLTAWASSGESDAGEKAEQLLQRMEDMYSRGNRGIKPDTVTFNAVIKVW